MARQAQGGGNSLREDQLGRRGARRSADRRARHDRDDRTFHRRCLEDARDSVQVLGYRLLRAAPAADARPAQRRNPRWRAWPRRQDHRPIAPSEGHLGGLFMVTALSHVSIAVPDLEAAARQLHDKYGLRVGARMVNAEQGVRLAYVEFGSGKIELMEPSRPDSPIARFLAQSERGGIH